MQRGNLGVPIFGRLAIVVTVSLGAAIGALGCLSSDNSSPGPGGSVLHLDAGNLLPPVVDASGSVTPPTPDGAPSIGDDAGEPSDDAGPLAFDAGPPDSGPPTGSQVGLVGGGTLSRSAHYVLVGSTGPATAPVLKSSSYQLTGGMAASK
jgi:hypothetical protein